MPNSRWLTHSQLVRPTTSYLMKQSTNNRESLMYVFFVVFNESNDGENFF